MASHVTRGLLVVPKFNPHSFWSYEGAMELFGTKASASPLGIITLAALLPPSWDLRLVNRNTEDLSEADLAWADVVLTGGMLAQQFDTLEIVRLCRQRALPVMVGGPDATLSPQLYAEADFVVGGEVEDVIDEVVAAWDRGERRGRFEAPKFKVDVTKTPIPRFDLLKLDQYMYIGVQFSRGCPFTCEFCDIIEIYGRKPRTKTSAQMLAELDALHALGWRGHVDFVDDNLIGNKKAVKAFLPDLIAWQKARSYPFMLSSEASINLAEDVELMEMMREANFFVVFVGIESPDPEVLKQTSKKQNIKHKLAESIARIYEHGMLVLPGLILGFDSEKDGAGAAILQAMEDANLPIGTLSLLYALPGTQLTRRLEIEGRLRPGVGVDTDRRQGDFTLAGLNFETERPRIDILRDFVGLLEGIYEPRAYFARTRRAVLSLNRTRLPWWIYLRDNWREIDRFRRLMTAVTLRRPEMRWRAWSLIAEVAVRNPRAIRSTVVMTVFFFYAQPLSRIWIREALKQIARAELEAATRAGFAVAAE